MVDKVVVVYNIAVSPSYTVYCIWSNRTQCHHQLAISTIFLLASKLCCLGTTTIRGGVEDTRLEAKAKDTRLEAKAKDTKKIRGQGQGQGQPFRGQTLSRPRTGMLEAKAKDTSASALQNHKNFLGDLKKKKVFTKIFQAVSTKKRFPKTFSSASQNFSNSKNTAVLEPRTGQFSRT